MISKLLNKRDNIAMTQDYSQVNFRIPTKLKNKIEEAAKANERSITGELVSRLEDSFIKEGLNVDVLRKMIDGYNDACIEFADKIEHQSKLIEHQSKLIQDLAKSQKSQ